MLGCKVFTLRAAIQSCSLSTARALFASTLEPLRFLTLRPPAVKIEQPSKYRILSHVSKPGL